MNQQAVAIIVGTLHNLATAAWIGGMLALALAVLPSVRQTLGKGPQSMQLLASIQSRLSVVTTVSIVVLLLTGLLLSRRFATTGIISANITYRIVLAVKHVLSAAMLIVAIARSRFVAADKMKLKAGLLLLNIILGTGVIALSSWIAALASTPR